MISFRFVSFAGARHLIGLHIALNLYIYIFFATVFNSVLLSNANKNGNACVVFSTTFDFDKKKKKKENEK